MKYDYIGLSPFTTYYWRVDEFAVTGLTKGDVWSFSVLPEIPVVDPNLLALWTLDEGVGVGLVKPAQRRDVVSNSLVVIVPASAPKLPATLAELNQPGFTRIAIGLPDGYEADVLPVSFFFTPRSGS